MPTRSQTVGQYDPTLDVNHDGKINMADIGMVARAFGTSGDPTAPVTINGYNSSTQTYDINIPALSSGNLNITTNGYSRVTVGMSAPALSQPVAIATGFNIVNDYISIDNFSLGSTVGPTPHPANATWVEPATTDISGKSAGYEFNVTLWANSSIPICWWTTDMRFDTTYLYAMGAGYTDGVTSQFFAGHATTTLPPEINNTGGEVLCGEVLQLPSNSLVSGYGSLCWIEFMLISPVSSTTLDINNPATMLAINTTTPDQFYPIFSLRYSGLVGDYSSSSPSVQVAKVYSVIGPSLRIDYNNPNNSTISVHVEIYLTTAP
jgi:hypothetical protein